jgi:transaldolase
MNSLKNLKIKIFADGANVKEMVELNKSGIVQGFTTNPTLMRKDGVKDYESFAKKILSEIRDLPVSFEVFSDEFELMEKEARKIATWGSNVYVKIPITNTRGESSIPLIKKLTNEGLSLNITAILTLEQVENVIEAINDKTPIIISVFAGRIADTGRDPVPYMKRASEIVRTKKNAELLWASSRELLNLFQAAECGCHIITITNDVLKKLKMIGKDIKELSLDTVKMFYNDALNAGFKII